MARFLELRSLVLSEMPEEVLSECKEYALGFNMEECCGIIIKDNGKLIFKPCDNISSNKQSFFVINPLDMICDGIEYIFHSHWQVSEQPSFDDIKSSDELCIPFLIYSSLTDKFCLYPNISV